MCFLLCHFSLQFIASIFFLLNSGEARAYRPILMHFCCIQLSKKEGALKEKMPVLSFILVLPFLFITHLIYASLHNMTSRFITCLTKPWVQMPPPFLTFPLAQCEGHPACWESASILLHCLTHLLAQPTAQCSCNHLGQESMPGRRQSNESLQRHSLNSSGCFLSFSKIHLSHIIKLSA